MIIYEITLGIDCVQVEGIILFTTDGNEQCADGLFDFNDVSL